MNWKASYEHIEEGKILLRTFEGSVGHQQVMESTIEVISKGIVTPDHIGVISDYRKCDLLPIVPIEETPILDFYHSLPAFCLQIKLAEIIDNHLNWFVLYMAEKYPDYNAKAFSTMKAAKEWILS